MSTLQRTALHWVVGCKENENPWPYGGTCAVPPVRVQSYAHSSTGVLVPGPTASSGDGVEAALACKACEALQRWQKPGD